MPYMLNFWSKMWWLMVSKHFEISKRQTSFIFSSQSSITRWRLVCVEWPFRYADWSGEIKACSSRYDTSWERTNCSTILGNVPNYWNRSIIRHGIHISIILINRGNPGKFPVIWKSTAWKGIIYDTQQGINNMFASKSDKSPIKS